MDLTASRTKALPALLGSLLVAAAALALAWALIFANKAGATASNFVVVGFVTGLAAFSLSIAVGAIARPARLITDAKGLTLRTWWRTRRWSWPDVANFRYRPAAWRVPAAILFDALAQRDEEPGQVTLPAGWRIKSDEVVQALRDERARYAGQRSDIAQTSPRFGWVIVASAIAVICLALMLAAQFGAQQADDVSDQYIQRAEFSELPGCPSAVRAGDYIPVRCDDPRYSIREGFDRYNLPYPNPRSKSAHWLRVGPNALSISHCGSKRCEVDQVVPNAFASVR